MSRACTSCGAEIIMARTTRSKRMPVDKEPNPKGNVMLDRKYDPEAQRWFAQATVVKDPEEIYFEDMRYMPHWATCKSPEKHRRR